MFNYTIRNKKCDIEVEVERSSTAIYSIGYREFVFKEKDFHLIVALMMMEDLELTSNIWIPVNEIEGIKLIGDNKIGVKLSNPFLGAIRTTQIAPLTINSGMIGNIRNANAKIAYTKIMDDKINTNPIMVTSA